MKRKLLALLLCAVLVLMAIPLTGLAVGGITAGLEASAESVAAGGEFTVSIVAEGAQNAADVLFTYDSTLVEYVSATEEPRYTADGKILFLDVDTAQEGIINTFTFKAKESVTAVGTATFTILHAKFAERKEAMSDDAKDAALDPASVNVTILPKYTVTFNDDEGKEIKSQTVIHGSKATAPADPTKTGCTFKGWSDGTSILTAADINGKAVSAAVTYQAEFEINKYAVKFTDEAGTEIETQTIEYNKTATAPADPTKTGCTFKGWSDGTSTLTAADINGKAVSAAVTYMPVFELSFTLTQNADYVGGYVEIVLTDAELDGYTFDGSAMYRLTDDTYAYLYPLAQGSELPTEAEIRAKLAAAEDTDDAHDLSAQYGTGNVNTDSNLIDIADAEAAYNCQKVYFAVADYMDVYLRSDMDHDGCVNSTDVDAILAIIENGYKA